MTRNKVLAFIAAAALAVSAFAQQQTQQQTQQTQTGEQQTTGEQQMQPGMTQQQTQPGMTQTQFGTGTEFQDASQALTQLMTYLQRLEQRISALERQVRAPRALERARADLQTLGPRVTAGDDPEMTAQEFDRIRTDLERGFTGLTGPAQQRWMDLTGEFEQFGERIRAGETIEEQEWQQFLTRFDDPAWQQDFEQDFDFDSPTMQQQRGQQALQRARTGVAGLRERALAGEDREGVATELSQIRMQLEQDFAGLTGVDQQRWTELRGQFEGLEEDIRAGEDIDETRWQEFEGGFEGWQFQQSGQQQPGTGMQSGQQQPGTTPGTGTDAGDDTDTDDNEDNDNDGDNGGN